MKKLLLLLAAVLLLPVVSLAAQEEAEKETVSAKNKLGLHFFAEPCLSCHSGTHYEYVYCTTRDNTQESLLSQLDWEQTPLFFAGGRFGISIKNIELCGGGVVALPYRKTGIVRDYDWLNREYAPLSCPDEIFDLLTHYSESDCSMNFHYQLDFSLGYNFAFANGVTVKPFAQLSYETIYYQANGLDAWYGKQVIYDDGYWYYTSYDDDEKNVQRRYNLNTVTVLELERFSYTTWLGAELSVPVKRLRFEFSAAFSPYCYMQSLDSHLMTGDYFLDRISAFFCGMKGSLGAAFCLDSHNSLGLVFSAQGVSGLYGKTYSSTVKDGVYGRAGSGGASFDSVAISVKYRLFL